MVVGLYSNISYLSTLFSKKAFSWFRTFMHQMESDPVSVKQKQILISEFLSYYNVEIKNHLKEGKKIPSETLKLTWELVWVSGNELYITNIIFCEKLLHVRKAETVH